MADWKKLSGTDVTFNCAANPEVDNKIYTYIEYDADHTTPTSTRIRFRGWPEKNQGGATSWNDSFYVLYNPNNNPAGRQVRLIKSATKSGGRWDVAECSYITITKGYKDETFYIQDYWICNNGYNANSMDPDDLTEASTAYTYFSGKRVNWVQKGLGSKSYAISASTTVATDVEDGTVGIEDLGNNKFKLTGTYGKAGTNNPIEPGDENDSYLRWGYSSTTISTNFKNGDVVELPKSDLTKDYYHVYAKCLTDGTYNNPTVEADALVYQYVAPNAPSAITITKSKTRLTIKEPWTVSWTCNGKVNNSSPVEGYRIRIYKKAAGSSTFSTIPFYSKTTGELLSSDGGVNWGNDRYYYDRTVDKGTTMTMYPDIQGIVPGDTIKIGLYAYTKNGQGTKIFNSTQVLSDDYPVQNAGVVRVKVGGKWKEGQVWTKVAGTWKEAAVIKTKVSGSWKESE